MNVQSQYYIIGLVAIGSPTSPYLNVNGYNSTSTSRRLVNNVLYPTYPQIDSWGIAILANASVLDVYTATGVASSNPGALISNAQSNTTEFVLYTDQTYLVYDVVYSRGAATGALVQNHNWADTLNVQTQAQYNALVPSVYKTQMAWTYGVCGNDYVQSPTKYNFCYYVDNSNSVIAAGSRGLSYTYGVMTAKTGLTRYGQPAMQLQGMTGVHTVFNSQSNTAVSYSLVELAAPNGLYETFLASQGDFWLTDNVLFTQSPWFSEAGLGLSFARFSNLTYVPAQPSSTNYMNVYSTWATGNGPFGITEWAIGDNNFPYTPFLANQSVSNFNYTPYVAGQVAQCSLQNNKVSEELITLSFCWFRQSGSAQASGYLNQLSAVIYAYSQPVYRNGRAGYVIQTMVGQRVYADIHGFVQSDTITGLSGDSIATSFGGFNAQFSGGSASSPYDNLIFDTAPHLSSGGVLYQVNGLLADYELTASATIAGNGYALDSIGRLWFDEGGAVFGSAPPYQYYDESLFNISTIVNATTGAVTTGIWDYIDLAGPQTRQGRLALAVQGMTGVRGLQFTNGSLYTQNIINVEYVNEDTFTSNGAGYVWLTDNLVFPTGVPEVSVLGLSYSTPTPPIMPAGAGGSDIIISTDGLSFGNSFYEAVGNENFDVGSPSYMMITAAPSPQRPTHRRIHCSTSN